MRPTRFLGFAAALAVASLTTVADAQSASPPSFTVSGGNLTVTAGGSTHLNNTGYPWKYLDSAGNKVKQVSDFTFNASSNPTSVSVSGVPAGGTLKGAYCDASNCYTFQASCSATGCNITGT